MQFINSRKHYVFFQIYWKYIHKYLHRRQCILACIIKGAKHTEKLKEALVA